MGFASEAIARLSETSAQSLFVLAGLIPATLLVLAVVLNVLNQLLFKDPTAPPLVFHWFPVIGSTITYGINPYDFFFANRKKYGDTFTFVLLGKKVTVCLGPKGSDFVLNGKLKDVCAEDVYGHLCTPVFGSDVVYDCPNSKLMEQKKFVKFGLTSEALRSYVQLITQETRDFARNSPMFQGNEGVVNITNAMGELTIYTASASLQGKEVRSRFDSTFNELVHDLDAGFSPINFMLPWAPLPQNRKRDAAREKMASIYLDIIRSRRESGREKDSEDMIWNLMNCTYKNGTPVPDQEVAHMMIALLMAGQHSSSATTAWIILRLSTRPDIVEELLEEQKRVLGEDLPPLTNDNLPLLLLNAQVVKETLRIHVPIHSIMRNVKSPMPMEGTSYTIPKSHWVLASPGASSRMEQYFPDPLKWEPHRWDNENEKKDADEEDEKVDFGYGLVSKAANSPYIPFGAGRHRCIGEQFAYIQIGAIIATWVRLFKLSPVGEFPGTDYSSLFSRPLNPAKVKWEKREKVEKS